MGMLATQVPTRRLTGQSVSPHIGVLSDRAVFRDCVVEYLRQSGFSGATGSDKCAAFGGAFEHQGPSLLLLDLGQEHEDSTEELREIRRRWPSTTAVAIGTPIQLAAQASDADGWVEVSDPGARLFDIARAATVNHEGHLAFKASVEVSRQIGLWRSLTRRQRQVLALLGCGVDNREIGQVLRVSERAVKLHVSALLGKFGCDNRVQLALIAAHAGLRAKENERRLSNEPARGVALPSRTGS
jgi:DNA-binding NarL/FixJ family response regulator